MIIIIIIVIIMIMIIHIYIYIYILDRRYVVEQRLHQHAAWNSHGRTTAYSTLLYYNIIQLT